MPLTANSQDAHGRAQERVNLNARVTSLASAISAWSAIGDPNGLRDLQMKQADANDRLTKSSTASGTGKSNFDTAFAYSGFSLEQVST